MKKNNIIIEATTVEDFDEMQAIINDLILEENREHYERISRDIYGLEKAYRIYINSSSNQNGYTIPVPKVDKIVQIGSLYSRLKDNNLMEHGFFVRTTFKNMYIVFSYPFPLSSLKTLSFY